MRLTEPVCIKSLKRNIIWYITIMFIFVPQKDFDGTLNMYVSYYVIASRLFSCFPVFSL